jgi:hypothetical protein
MKQVVLAVLIVLLFSTCKKKDDVEYSVYAAQDHAVAETLFNELVEIVYDVAKETDGIRGYDACINSVIVDTLSIPRSILIDFGQDDCAGSDGRIRKGMILAEFSGRYREDGSVITISPSSFTVDDFEIHGTKTITNLGENANGNLEFEVVVSNGQIDAPNNEYTIHWDATTTREWVEGDISNWFIDDVYLIRGSANGVNRNGVTFDAVITTPLKVEVVCPWFTEGVVVVTPDGGDPRTLDYGLGDCNSVVTVSVNGQTYTITF